MTQYKIEKDRYNSLLAAGFFLVHHCKQFCKPYSLSIEDLDADSVARERDVLIEQAKASGKPQEIAEKMVEGRMKKYYQEVVLLEQTSVIDGETRIADVIAKAGKDAGADIALKAFVRFNLGEGVEREESDFAAEVAAQLS